MFLASKIIIGGMTLAKRTYKTNWFENNSLGFTLVELVIVIAILSILSVLLVPRIVNHAIEAKTNREIADARMLASEVATYNAIAKIDGTTTIPDPLPSTGPQELTRPMLDSTSLALPDDESFPDNSIVKIMIDSEGNAILIY